jgi:hypothetical protein
MSILLPGATFSQKRAAIYLISILASVVSVMPVPAQVTERPLRVMSFNLWYSGKKVENGIEKIAKHIRIVDPDIVGLQVLSEKF